MLWGGDTTPQTLPVSNVQKTLEGFDECVSKRTNEADGEKGEKIQRTFELSDGASPRSSLQSEDKPITNSWFRAPVG